LKILFLAAEATPLVKVGGLADVAGELPRELAHSGLDVRTAVPLHSTIDRSKYPLDELCRFPVARAGSNPEAIVYSLKLEDNQFWLLDGEPVRAVDGVYGQPDQDGEKYAFWSKAALKACEACDWQPDILHANDWHAAAAVNLLDCWRKQAEFWSHSRSLLTIHNLAYMGSQSGRAAYAVPAVRHPALPSWAEELPLPNGIAAADWLSTVSPSYAREIQTPEYGAGLEDLLGSRADRLTGIMNGIDDMNWDPSSDPALAHTYAIETLALRSRNKGQLQEETGLPAEDIPLIGMITRLDHQKGVDLALDGLEEISDEAWQFILLGTGDPALETLAREFAARHPERARALLKFDSLAARRLYAGVDMLLIPSRYEPCGLAQLIGMRYGAVPVVRGTGGLKDSVLDVDRNRQGTGFVFEPLAVDSLVKAIRRALQAYRDEARWRSIQEMGMRQDHSWVKTASAYVELYRSITNAEL
jgi:starch synthase